MKLLQKKIIKNSLRFLVDDFEVAKTLLNASCKIPFKDFPKVSCCKLILSI